MLSQASTARFERRTEQIDAEYHFVIYIDMQFQIWERDKHSVTVLWLRHVYL